jgi:hypothetical protein
LTAVLAKILPQAPELTNMKVGYLPPHKEIKITCFFHQLIEVEDLSWKFFLPCHVIPKAVYMGNMQKYITEGRHLKDMPIGNTDRKARKLREKYWKEAERSLRFKSGHNWFLEIIIESPTELTR